MAWVTPTSRSTGDLMTAAIWNQDVVNNPIALTPVGFTFVIDGGGAVIVAEAKGPPMRIPLNGNISALYLANDEDASATSKVSISVDIRHTSNLSAGYPNSTSSIMDSTGLVITSGTLAERTSLGAITPVSWSKGDWLTFVVNSATTCKRAAVAVDLTRD